jgi:hypothetical protein
MNWHRQRWLLAALILLLAEAGPVLAESLSTGKIQQPPMVIYLAKGAPNACGTGCSAWIAADGFIDEGAAERLRKLIATLHGRTLPIFFNSLGGSQINAIAIGRVIRKHGMAAAVWKTRPVGCTGHDDEACRRLMQSGGVLAAELSDIAYCMSSCIYALLGGAARQVPSNAIVHVHAPLLAAVRPDGSMVPPSISAAAQKKLEADFNDKARAYIRAMGIDERLLELILATPNERPHTLTRTEITNFGIDTGEWICPKPGPCAPPNRNLPQASPEPTPASQNPNKP